ncbi:MAG: FixH family protein [Trueperaceae bacterium]|nr:FixH family protein [Trueperaceae bacterium]
MKVSSPVPGTVALRRVSRWLLSILLATSVVACRPPEAGGGDASRTVSARVIDDSPRTGPATIEVEVLRDGERVAGASVRVTGDMTHAGMIPVVSDAVDLGDGRYRTESFAFTMAGDWILSVDVTYPDAVTRQVSVPLSVGR